MASSLFGSYDLEISGPFSRFLMRSVKVDFTFLSLIYKVDIKLV